MILQLNALKLGKTHFKERVNGLELQWRSPLPQLVEYPLVEVFVEKRPRLIILNLSMEFQLRLTCSRCLEEFISTFKEKTPYYIRFGREKITREKHLSEEEVVTLWTTEEVLDLTPLIRETMVLAIPMKPLCSTSCKGLCPICGVNLNRRSCSHTKEELSFKITKLSKLKDLLKEGG